VTVYTTGQIYLCEFKDSVMLLIVQV